MNVTSPDVRRSIRRSLRTSGTVTECDEVAAAMPSVLPGSTLDDARHLVRRLMPEESHQVIENVAYALYLRSAGTSIRPEPRSSD